ncbi:hypothetical protein FACS1894206_03510 [Deltaproteobacteria bacterium]|nr:hypothetical protein FACS1894206_03510 [Deltaproteobacteria bacterium]
MLESRGLDTEPLLFFNRASITENTRLTTRPETSKEIRSDISQGASDYEKNIPAQPNQTQKNAWLS